MVVVLRLSPFPRRRRERWWLVRLVEVRKSIRRRDTLLDGAKERGDDDVEQKREY